MIDPDSTLPPGADEVMSHRRWRRRLPCVSPWYRARLLATVAIMAGSVSVAHAQQTLVEGDPFTIGEGVTEDWSFGPLIVGNEQDGELLIEGVLKSADFYLGRPPENDFTFEPLPGYEDILGTVVVSGKNALWEANFTADADWQGYRIGYKSNGNLTIENGGTVHLSGEKVYVGNYYNSVGTVLVTGGAWDGDVWKPSEWIVDNTIDLGFGHYSKGIMIISNGGHVKGAGTSIDFAAYGDPSEVTVEGVNPDSGVHSLWEVGGTSMSDARAMGS